MNTLGLRVGERLRIQGILGRSPAAARASGARGKGFAFPLVVPLAGDIRAT